MVEILLTFIGKWEDWPSALTCCNRIKWIPIQTPLGTRSGLGTQHRYEAPGYLRVETEKSNYEHPVSEVVPSIMAQQGLPWGSEIANKKMEKLAKKSKDKLLLKTTVYIVLHKM